MKKGGPIFFIVYFLILCSSSLAQQNGGQSLNVNISANITSSIKILTIQPLNLEDAEINNEVIRVNPHSSPNAGKIVAIGSPSSKIRIKFPKNHVLRNQNGSSTLKFIFTVTGNNQNNQAAADLLDEENEKIQLSKDGRFYFWIGGHVNTSTALPGNYIGEFSLNIRYF